MKTPNTTNLNETVSPVSENTVGIELNMPVYNELNDQHQGSVNVLAMINEQFKQIFEMNKRRAMLLKEVAGYIVK